MPVIIAAEHFELTPSIRERVERASDRISEILPMASSVRVFLARKGRRSFSALFKVRSRSNEIVCEEKEEDLYVAITRAASRVRQVLLRKRQKRIHFRRERRYEPE